ncbi:MAG TPA: GNAT family N-acetyltransferase, partial [Acidimicrobiales bacterium]|nr:GNAT family N-acetyltransferase [Acidimicrobiales bacterium]
AWNRLADDAEASMFVRPFWCLTWWEHLGRGQLSVVVAEEDGELVALAPLHRRRVGMVDVVRFLGFGLGSVGELLVAPGREADADAVWDEALGHGQTYLQLVEYRDGGHGLKALQARNSAETRVLPHDVCPVIAFDGDIDEYLATRKKGHRRNLRKARERLEAEGRTFALEEVETPERLAEVYAESAEVYHAAERANPRLDIFRPPWDSFTATLLRRAAQEGHLRLCIGRIDGRAVSCDLAFLTPRRLALWAGRFDPDYRPFVPGHYALRSIAARALEEGRVIDLLIGDDPYKQAWTGESYATLSVEGASGPVAGRLGGLAIELGERAHERREARARPEKIEEMTDA